MRRLLLRTVRAAKPLVVSSAILRQPTRLSADFSSDYQTRRHFSDYGKRRENDVVVVAIGWFGSQKRHLGKYCEAWQQLGAREVVCYTPSLPAMFFKGFCDLEARRFLDTARRNLPCNADGSPPTKVIWHVFSQGGFTFFGSVLRQLLERPDELPDPELIENSSVVFDCGPCLRLTKEDAVVGVLTGLGGRDENFALNLYSKTPFKMIWDFGWTIYDSAHYSNWSAEVLDSFDRARFRSQYYLYTAEDKVIKTEAIVEFMERQKGLGSAVTARKWETGEHVQLLRRHQKEYTRTLSEIIGKTS